MGICTKKSKFEKKVQKVYNNEATVVFLRDYEFFTPLDIISSILGFTVILIIVLMRQRNHRDQPHYKYYSRAFLFKALFVMANATFYIVAYGGGGDSIAFWDGAAKLNNLFWDNPYGYFQELFEFGETRDLYQNFNLKTGYPDRHTYIEPESFFISKIASIFTFFTFKGYILMSLIFAFITTNASWRLYELVRSYNLHSDWILALAIFFIPSLSFWCGGISKDTVVFVSICYFLYNLFQIISIEKKSNILNWFGMLMCLYILFTVRSFMLAVVLAPLLFAYSVRISQRFKNNAFSRNFIKFMLISMGIAGILLFFLSSVADQFLSEAAVINQDMTHNKTYGTNRYDLGITDFSPLGMVKAFPASVIAGFYQPFIWQALSVSLILNGIESIVLMYLTFRFFASRNLRERFRTIRKNEFLIYALFFALILAYFAGFTSILYGVLVRFKAPVLPFLVIVLTSYMIPEAQKKLQKDEDFKKGW